MRGLRNTLVVWLLLALGSSAYLFDRVPPYCFMTSWLLPVAAGALFFTLLIYLL